jgi:hypothetical protein
VKVADQVFVDFGDLGGNFVVRDGQQLEVEMSACGVVGNVQVKMLWDEKPIDSESAEVTPCHVR